MRGLHGSSAERRDHAEGAGADPNLAGGTISYVRALLSLSLAATSSTVSSWSLFCADAVGSVCRCVAGDVVLQVNVKMIAAH